MWYRLKTPMTIRAFVCATWGGGTPLFSYGSEGRAPTSWIRPCGTV